ncbi:Rrf2 family transcriptional regulator [Exiguobacterium antarcticum]|uniref:Rrf2 family transcriptional regulator n=1 Tax=Exiguobacterium antarcticum TaxID=132920 RepID=A0ABT6R4K5_9BACL|nr:Rrf2 family transcriptional regulator [Exiguobacterium antarcticum]MDI3235768.1 Rrf2 family transcriptional regulator [Exiguobacterium antarcticum]
MINSRLAVSVHILALIATHPDQALSSEYIAGSVNTNPVVIRRLTGLLRHAGLLKTVAGKTGATLTKDPAAITLLMVYRAVEPKETLFSMHEHPNPACPVGRNIQSTLDDTFVRAQQALEAELEAETLSDIIHRLATAR